MDSDAAIISVTLCSSQVTTMGPVECGKTCLIKRFCEGRFENRYIPTIGLDYGMQPVTIKGKPVLVLED